MAYTAGDVMNSAASLLNDTGKALYSYAVQIPYLKMAQQEIEQELLLNEVPLSLISEAIIDVAAGAVSLALPTSFFLPINLQERADGSTLVTDFADMDEVVNVYDLGLAASSSLTYWDYRHNCINFIGATGNREVRLYYWRLMASIVDEGSNEPIIGANNFLSFRTAALISQYIIKDDGRAAALNLDAIMAKDRLMTILVKNNQGGRVRRLPFRVGRSFIR